VIAILIPDHECSDAHPAGDLLHSLAHELRVWPTRSA